jgi:CRISPR-associated protein Cas1
MSTTKRSLQVPLHHLSGLVTFGNVMVSPALMHRLADEGKSLVLLDDTAASRPGWKARSPATSCCARPSTSSRRHPPVCLEQARAMHRRQIAKNSRALVMRGAREAPTATKPPAHPGTPTTWPLRFAPSNRRTHLDALRGVEGEAARGYFAALNLIVKPQARDAFALNGRTRRPPLDRFNALLSFLYSMLMNDCRSALETVGLDPQLGFLHAVRPGRAALALDLQEEFRSVLADRFALTLINRGQIVTEGDFDLREGGAVMLNDKGRRAKSSPPGRNANRKKSPIRCWKPKCPSACP